MTGGSPPDSGTSEPTDGGYEDAYTFLHRLALTRARRVLQNEHDAEEIAQEAMLRAYSSWSTVFLYAEGWVTKVATNLAISRLRRRNPTAETPPFEESADNVGERVDLMRALATLPTRQQQVAMLRHLSGLDTSEIADVLGISAGSVKRHLHRAATTLKSLPTLAVGYSSEYEFEQRLRQIRVWLERNIVPAVEPSSGWPPPPWDSCLFITSDYKIERLVVDANGDPLLDADGDEVVTGPGFGHALCKPLRGDGAGRPVVTVPLASLAPDAEEALERAHEIALRFGSCHVGEEHLGLALAERLGDPPPLEQELLRRGIALFYDGPHADARLELVAARDAAGWTRTLAEGVLPPEINMSLSKALKYAASRATARGELATCDDLVEGLLQPPDLPAPPPPPTVLRFMQLGRENRIPKPIEEH